MYSRRIVDENVPVHNHLAAPAYCNNPVLAVGTVRIVHLRREDRACSHTDTGFRIGFHKALIVAAVVGRRKPCWLAGYAGVGIMREQ